MGFQTKIMALAGLVNLFMPISMAIDPNCDYYQDMVLGQQYWINNQQYPGYYGQSTSCRWMAYSPIGTRIVISCELDLPSSSNCNGDRFSISLTGNVNFADARNYCGTGSITLVTDSNAMVAGLFSTWGSNGGRFLCSLVAVQDGTTSTSTTARPNVCDCGWKQMTRIVGGHETGVNEYPLMAGLVELRETRVYCGGSIISERYVLTAAHCLYRRDTANVGVLVGDHNVSTGAETSASRLYSSQQFIIHPDYSSSNQLNDVAIIKTTLQISFSLYVGPVCLPFRYSTYSFQDETVTALGWGQLEFSGPQSDTLQEVDLKVININTCQQEMSENEVTLKQICTYAPGKDACQSDSGGPVLWWDQSTRRLQLTGILSYGIACATELPGVSTRVTSYLTWIVSETSDANYCIK